MASFVWLLLTEPTYNQTHLAALAWRARILGQKALRNVSRFPSGVGAFCPRMTTFYFKQSEFCQQRPQCERGRRDLGTRGRQKTQAPVVPSSLLRLRRGFRPSEQDKTGYVTPLKG